MAQVGPFPVAQRYSPESILGFSSHFVEVSGCSMHYLDEGTGPVVLLLHGNPTWCYFYRNLIKELKNDFRVIAPDYIGCGLSDRPRDRHFRALDRVEHLQEFVRILDIRRCSLVMHDWGGPIGTGFSVRNPDLIERLVYLNTTLTETEALPAVIKRAASPFVGKLLTQYTMHFLKLMTRFGVCQRLPKHVCHGYYYPYRSISRRTAIWDFVADIPFSSEHPTYSEMLDIATRIPELSHVPVKIVWGLKDPCFHRGMLSNVAKLFPRAELLELPEASHLVLEDAPEVAGRAIRSFLLRSLAASEVPYEAADVSASGTSHTPVVQNALFAAFQALAASDFNADAVVIPEFLLGQVRYQHIKYRDFFALVNSYQRGLAELGLRRGDKALMLVKPGVDFLALAFAVMGRSAVPVFVDPGIGRDNLFSCIKDCNPDVFIGSPKAHLLRLKRNELFPNLRFHITASDWIYTAGPGLGYLKRFSSTPLPAVHADDTALIAFTSGATGTPKGVIFTNDMLKEQLRIFSKEFAVKAGRKDLPLLPVFSIYNLAVGITSVFPPMNPSHPLDVAPERIVKIVTDLEIDYSFGSPTLWNKIAEYCVRARTTLPSIKKVFMAGAPVSDEVLKRVKSILPGGEAYTPYGSTEALPVTLISETDISQVERHTADTGEIGTLVGKPLGQIEVRIVQNTASAISDISEASILPPRTIGEVIVCGANVSPEYLARPAETVSAKIPDRDRFWHRMGDVGYLDEAGNLYYCGRKAHAVHTPNRTYFSVPVERIFNAHDKVRRSALVPYHGGQRIAVVIEPLPQFWPDTEDERKRLEGELMAHAARNPLTAAVERIFFYKSFPVDARHNAKIFREKLASWAEDLEKGAGH